MIRRYIGKINWMFGDLDNCEGSTDSVRIDRAILNDHLFKIDYHSKNEEIGSGLISLSTDDELNYNGRVSYIDYPEHYANVNVKFYQNQDKAILIGNWIENTEKFVVIITLEEVKKFES